jgi:hypothetical protein
MKQNRRDNRILAYSEAVLEAAQDSPRLKHEVSQEIDGPQTNFPADAAKVLR